MHSEVVYLEELLQEPIEMVYVGADRAVPPTETWVFNRGRKSAHFSRGLPLKNARIAILVRKILMGLNLFFERYTLGSLSLSQQALIVHCI